MAATVTAVGTGLLTGYGIANDLGKNPANPLTRAVAAAKDTVELTTLKAQLQAAKTQLVQFEVEKLKERAERLKEEIQMYASEQEPTQTGGASLKDIQIPRDRIGSTDGQEATTPGSVATALSSGTDPRDQPPPAPTETVPPPPAPTETGPDLSSLSGALSSAVLQAVGTPTPLLPGLEKLRTRIDTQVLKDLTVETWKEKLEILLQIEKAFRDLREARKRNEPLDDRALAEKVAQLLARVEAYWTDTLSTALATAPPAVVEQYFDLRAKVRTLKSELGEDETSELTNRYNELATEFVALQTAAVPSPAPQEPGPAPVPEPPAPVPEPPAPVPEPPAPVPEPPAPVPEPPAPVPEPGAGTGLVPARSAETLRKENEDALLADLRAATSPEDLDARVAEYRTLLEADPSISDEARTRRRQRLEEAARVQHALRVPVQAPEGTWSGSFMRTMNEQPGAVPSVPTPQAPGPLSRRRGTRSRSPGPPGGTVSTFDLPSAPLPSTAPVSSTEAVPVQATEDGGTFSVENPLRTPAREPGGPLPGGTGAGAYGSPTATELMKAQVTPQGSTARTLKKRKVNLDGGRKTLRKKRLTSRRGNKTNGQ